MMYLGQQQKMNWMKNASVGSHVIFVEATSVSHVQEIVRDTVNYPSPIRPSGKILSPTSICSNDRGGTTLSTLKLNQIHGIKYIQVPNGHDQAGEVIPCIDVECGVTIRDAQIYAHKNSLELPFSGEMGMATIGGTVFAVTKDSSIGMPPVNGMGLGDMASTLWSVDIVESNGGLKKYTVMNENDGKFDKRFQALLDSYGVRGIAVRMLLTLRPQTPTTINLKVFPFLKDDNSRAHCANTLFETWKKASIVNGNICALIANKKGYMLIEERLPKKEAEHVFAPCGCFLDHFYHWLKKNIIQRGRPPSWISLLRPLSGTFALRFNMPYRRPGYYYEEDIPLENEKVTFTFASFPMEKFNYIVTATLDFIHTYEQSYGFTPVAIAMYVVNTSGQRIAGPFRGGTSGDVYRFCFDPVHNNPNDKAWGEFLVAFNAFVKDKGGRPCLNQTLMLENDISYGASAISSDYCSSRFISSWLQQFLLADTKEDI